MDRPLAGPPSASEALFLARLETARFAHPENLCARYLTPELFLSYSPELRRRLQRVCRSGADNPDSRVGCYLLRPDDLTTFGEFFAPLIRRRHAAGAAQPRPAAPDLDLASLGYAPVSTRVRLCRNLEGWPLPASMDRDERLGLEQALVRALQVLVDDPAYGGRINSLSPDLGPGRPNPNLIDATLYRRLVAAHLMFRPMDEDPYMASAGLAADWPYGRACYISADRSVAIWIGEEDHLRIIATRTGTRLAAAYDRLRAALSIVESLPGLAFLSDETYGYVTSCPSNLGTGLRASVRVTLPRHTNAGEETKEVCRRLGLAVTALAGDRAPVDVDGPVDLSPIRRFGLPERAILEHLYQGLAQLPGATAPLALVPAI